MKRFYSLCLTVLVVTGVCSSIVSAAEKTIEIKISTDTPKPEGPFQGKRASVDIAILLDTSNSMDGLIQQAKTQLWNIVQEFAEAKKNGQTPVLRVALFEYGNSNLPASEGYIRQAIQLTDDLDELSAALFALKTKGGDEYCGQVISAALKRLDWSSEPNGYKAIFIAGNEPFSQGSVDYRTACKSAIERGVIVNTIHCGSYAAGVSGRWEEGAKLAEGKYLNIDQDAKVVHIECPQDAIILRLNTELNKTYLWYGAAGQRLHFGTNQIAQDSNASQAAPGVLLQRTLAKSGEAYRNSKRDLVDAFAENSEVLGEIKSDLLPDHLQDLSAADREKAVKKAAARRKELQLQIAKLSRERDQHLAELQKQDASTRPTLGAAVTQAIDTQLKAAGFDGE